MRSTNSFLLLLEKGLYGIDTTDSRSPCYSWWLMKKKVYLNMLRTLLRDYPKECELEVDVVYPNFYQGFAQFANTRSIKKRKDYAQLVSTTNITVVEHRQGSSGKSRVVFYECHARSSHGGSIFGSLTPQTSSMADPTGIFHPSWNITCETDVLDSTNSSDFISTVFPQVTLFQMDKMSTDELTMRRHAHMMLSIAYNVGFDRRYKTELEEA
ncbi:unnamed protein product [Lactuca virosa]|uniref:Uncharacterized protein n=1 Tax=Lactuca virosa TaxID=75947 RepID=A0AAU9MNS0_9ASTR|nr:unnamed protein product [Lactuca virosa]